MTNKINGSWDIWNDLITSVDLGGDVVVIAHEDVNYGGRKIVWNSDSDSNGDLSFVGDYWNDKVSSLQIVNGRIRSESDPLGFWVYNGNGNQGRNQDGYIDPSYETVVIIHGWNNSDK